MIALTLALALTASTLAPRRAEAAIGAVLMGFGNPAGLPLLIAGGAAIAGGWAVGKYAHTTPTEHAAYFSVLIMLAGVIILDAREGTVPQYIALSSAQEDEIGLTAPERRAYATQLEEINSVAQTIGRELRQESKPTLSAGAARWTAHQVDLGVEAGAGVEAIDGTDVLHAVAKVSAHALNQVAPQ